MTQILKTSKFCILVILIMLSGIILAQENKENTKSLAGAEADIKITIRLVKARVKLGEVIDLRGVIENRSDHLIELPYRSPDLLGGFDVIITDSSGNIVKKTKDPFPNKMIGKRVHWEIGPNTTDDRLTLRISSFFDLVPGKYTVKIRRPVSVHSKTKDEPMVESNTVSLKVSR